MKTCLGSRMTEYIQLDNGGSAASGSPATTRPTTSSARKSAAAARAACTTSPMPTDQREDILRAADIFLENGVHIETGPHKHAIQGSFFLYVWEPAGNRVELANAGARLILAPTGSRSAGPRPTARRARPGA
jgi:catechol 2,3-dioxygenase